MFLLLFLLSASPIPGACFRRLLHSKTASLNQTEKLYGCCTYKSQIIPSSVQYNDSMSFSYGGADEFTAKLKWQNDGLFQQFSCDGRHSSESTLYWKFHDRNLNAKQRNKLSCTKRSRCTLALYPHYVDTVGKYSCCVSRCGRFVCFPKTISVESIYIYIINMKLKRKLQ